MKEQLIIGIVHGREEVYKLIDNVPHSLERDSKGYKWIKTILDPARMKKFRQVSAEYFIEHYCNNKKTE